MIDVKMMNGFQLTTMRFIHQEQNMKNRQGSPVCVGLCKGAKYVRDPSVS